jgi:G3E family GTPase
MADRIVLTKSDISSPHAVARLRERLAALNPYAPLVVANHGAVEAGWLRDLVDGPAFWARAEGHADHHHHEHNHGIRSTCLWFERPLDKEAFQRAIARFVDAHGEYLLRIKGLLNLAGEPRPVAVHGVGGFLHPLQPLADWPDADRRSRIVVIADRLGEADIAPFFTPLTHSLFEETAR